MTHPAQWGRSLLLALVAVLIATSSVWALEDYRFTESSTFQLGNEPRIYAESVAGDVTYRGGSSDETTVEWIIVVHAESNEEARQILEEIDVAVEDHKSSLDATVDRPDNFSKLLRRKFGRDRSVSVSFHITGPQGARVSLSSVSGLVRAEQVAGPVDASTVSGDVRVADVQERVRANSVSGSISIEDCADYIRAEAVSGDILVRNCGGDLNAESVSGSVDVADVVGEVVLSSVSGDIEARVVGEDVTASTTSGQIEIDHQKGSLELETMSGDIIARSASTEGELRINSHSGSVELYTDVDQIGKIKLSTFSGDMRVDSELGGKNALGRGSRSRGDVSLTLGNGQVFVRLDTFSGDIYIGEI